MAYISLAFRNGRKMARDDVKAGKPLPREEVEQYRTAAEAIAPEIVEVWQGYEKYCEEKGAWDGEASTQGDSEAADQR